MKLFESKRSLRNTIADLQGRLEYAELAYNKVVSYNNELADKVEYMMSMYPFTIGDTVYDVQLRSDKGRFTKTKASREHSIINEVVVDKKNYFNLVDRLHTSDVFTSRELAEAHLDEVCVK